MGVQGFSLDQISHEPDFFLSRKDLFYFKHAQPAINISTMNTNDYNFVNLVNTYSKLILISISLSCFIILLYCKLIPYFILCKSAGFLSDLSVL